MVLCWDHKEWITIVSHLVSHRTKTPSLITLGSRRINAELSATLPSNSSNKQWNSKVNYSTNPNGSTDANNYTLVSRKNLSKASSWSSRRFHKVLHICTRTVALPMHLSSCSISCTKKTNPQHRASHAFSNLPPSAFVFRGSTSLKCSVNEVPEVLCQNNADASESERTFEIRNLEW